MDTKHPSFLPVVEPENAEKPASEKELPEPREQEEEQDVYPVQQIAVTEPITEKEVKDAVRELNPDCNSMDSRG